MSVPDSWPPPLNDEGSQRWYLDMLQRDSDAVGWALWYVIASSEHRQIVGVAGFKLGRRRRVRFGQSSEEFEDLVALHAPITSRIE